MQNYSRIYDYIYDYWHLVYDIYGNSAIAYLVTYYNVDIIGSVLEDEKLKGGFYEKFGPLSGLRWDKYLLVPVFFVTGEMEQVYEAQEIGLTNETRVEFILPYFYGLTPYVNDIIKLDQKFLEPDPAKDIGSIYTVAGVSKQSPCEKTFWKLKAYTEQSRTILDVEAQRTTIHVFFDYDKKFHSTFDTIRLTNLLQKSLSNKLRLKNLYDQNTGFYLL